VAKTLADTPEGEQRRPFLALQPRHIAEQLCPPRWHGTVLTRLQQIKQIDPLRLKRLVAHTLPLAMMRAIVAASPFCRIGLAAMERVPRCKNRA
jgi:hypothetical protein